MGRNVVMSQNAGKTGPYSHAADADGFVFLSGQTPIDPATGQLVQGDIAVQTRQSFSNLFHVLEEAGLTPDDVQKVNVYLTDMNDFEAMNAVYAEQFSEPYPARSTVGVTALVGGAKIEIEMTARRSR
ncbi:RidA family protein [Extibacter muris]|uniref:RidA family protein n=1 Tax=Extibacter muris TaxID=1796622 RepID=UPI001D064696|nr:Rid family detoxifying hydrolase [Extibacter muris]MCB6200411.1 Rid family detoxifying hydrolase [Extibacter muris]MCQ4663478.1 Rid family detoxifying hydrolase [Extibacter muris]MCQ4692902.1 Rid family detoxifying hydrolase [Extibacter muris]